MGISAGDLLGGLENVTREWTKQRRAEERSTKSRASRQHVYSGRVDFTAVAEGILPGAYAFASGDGRYTVSKRQFYYACREQFREQTGRPLLWPYFSETLLVQYMNRHAETQSWKVTADPRGTLTIPNAGREVRIPCGTIQIDRHLEAIERIPDPFDFNPRIRTEWPSLAPGHRYQGVLYIEKEGFEPLLEEARIAERFDLAIMSCKGQSVVAARKFVDQVCAASGGLRLFVVHDLDKAGFEISQRLTSVSDWAELNDRVTYRFQNEINVVDLGLRLADAQQYGLAHEECEFKGRFARDSIATPEEQDFLRSGRRVELNAFTSPQFIEWLESKLNEHLPKRLIPSDEVLKCAYRRLHAVAEVNLSLNGITQRAIENARSAQIPTDLRRQLEEKLSNSSAPWDKVMYDLAEKSLLSLLDIIDDFDFFPIDEADGEEYRGDNRK
jgi:hypothetical protein